MSSRDRILRDLRDARGWFCGAAWYASFLPTFSQRISEMNRGYVQEAAEAGIRIREGEQLICSRVCHQEGHDHKSTIHEYALAKFAKPEQLKLSA